VAPQTSPTSGDPGTDGNAANIDRRNVSGQSSPTDEAPATSSGTSKRSTTGAAGKETQEDDAGAGNDADATSDSAETPPASGDGVHESCEVNGSCTSKCEDKPSVTCGIESTGFACEFEGFVGATAQVACGQHVVIGMACCGGCGCVPVEVFFDGTRCWQGAPQCELPQFTNQFLDPHATTKPNPSFTPPSSYFLGTGGFGGAQAADPAVGNSGAANAGGGNGGASGSAGASGGAGTSGSAGTGANSAGTSGSAGNSANSAGTGGSADSAGASGSAGSGSAGSGSAGSGGADSAGANAAGALSP
jgi:hypothetical protein